MKYKIILADPPWSYADQGCQGTMKNHYSGMDLFEICNMPVHKISNSSSILFLWATYPMMKEALIVMKSWGFTYKTIAFQWIKLNPKAMTPFYGLGRWTRGNTEPCLLGTKGRVSRIDNSVFQLIQSPIRGHSRKPDEARNKIVKLIGNYSRIELFAREKVKNWHSWGNEVDSDIPLDYNNW